WSSDVCSSDLDAGQGEVAAHELVVEVLEARRLAVLDPEALDDADAAEVLLRHRRDVGELLLHLLVAPVDDPQEHVEGDRDEGDDGEGEERRSEEHTSE